MDGPSSSTPRACGKLWSLQPAQHLDLVGALLGTFEKSWFVCVLVQERAGAVLGTNPAQVGNSRSKAQKVPKDQGEGGCSPGKHSHGPQPHRGRIWMPLDSLGTAQHLKQARCSWRQTGHGFPGAIQPGLWESWGCPASRGSLNKAPPSHLPCPAPLRSLTGGGGTCWRQGS